MRLKITRWNSRQAYLEMTRDDGAPEVEMLNPSAVRRVAAVAAKVGLSASQVTQLVLAVMQTPTSHDNPRPAAEHDVPGAQAAEREAAGRFLTEDLGLVVRGRTQAPEEGWAPFASLEKLSVVRDILLSTACPYAEPVVEWRGTDKLAVLDVDYHDVPPDRRPTWDELLNRAAFAQPAPFAYHPSHGRGCKLWYAATPDFTAAELAASAALYWCDSDPHAKVEILSRCRLPLYPRVGAGGAPEPAVPVNPVWSAQSSDVAAFRAYLRREASPEQIEQFLEENGLRIGERLPHSHCLIDPTHVSAQTVGPVVIGPVGIKCFSCEGRGVAYPGCRTPGFVPYSRLIGASSSDVSRMIACAAHWDHAKHVLKHHFPRLPLPILQLAYRTSLKAGAAAPELVDAAFRAGRDIVRVAGRWVSTDGSATIAKDHTAILRALPATWVEGQNKAGDVVWSPHPERVDVFKQAFDLTPYGYPTLTPILGCRIWGHRLPYADERIAFDRFAPMYRGKPHLAPKYRPLGKRMPIAAARGVLEQYFPGLPWEYLILTLVMKGLAEGRATQCPFLFVHGPAGAGKSTVPHLAAAIAGDVASEVQWSRDTKAFGTNILTSVEKGSFTVLNEVVKEGLQARVPLRTILDPFLNLTADTLAHRYYVGPVALGTTPVIIVTDVELPAALGYDVQIGRRFVNVPLDSRVNWAAGMARIGKPAHFRLAGEWEAEVADAIVSWVIDEFFSTPTPAADLVAALGFQSIEDSSEFTGRTRALLEFFQEIRRAPALTGTEAARFAGPGWVRIDLEAYEDPLTKAWYDVANSREGDGRTTSRAIKEADLRTTLGLSAVTHFDAQTSGRALYCRFRSGPYKEPTATNRELS